MHQKMKKMKVVNKELYNELEQNINQMANSAAKLLLDHNLTLTAHYDILLVILTIISFSHSMFQCSSSFSTSMFHHHLSPSFKAPLRNSSHHTPIWVPIFGATPFLFLSFSVLFPNHTGPFQ